MGAAAVLVAGLAVLAVAVAVLWGAIEGVVLFGRGIWRIIHEI